MSHGNKTTYNRLMKWFLTNTVMAGVFALLWLLLRSGTKPNRLVYPCQQAAFTTASLAFGAPIVAAMMAVRNVALRALGSRRALAIAGVGLFATVGLWGFLASSGATTTTRRSSLQPPSDYRATLYHVTHCPQEPRGDRFLGLDNLLKLMGREGLKFYLSPTVDSLSGPDGIIGSDDLVVIKINYQWRGIGGTNIDLLRGLIRSIVDHPDGFTGEVVVGENTQFVSSGNFDRSGNNAQDPSLSPRDVVDGFRAQGWQVSLSDWSQMSDFEADEHLPCDESRGYVVQWSNPNGRVSYPRFTTIDGSCVSLKEGIWLPGSGSYDRDRLKVINLPVLKPHGYVYGVTASVKHYMGVVTNGLNTGAHLGVASGLMGAVMAELGPPDLNILDCIWVQGNPFAGPEVGSFNASRLDQLVASTDPIALDIWATKNILVPEFLANGYTPPWPRPSADPDDPESTFRIYLDNSMDKLLEQGYRVTNDLNSIDVHRWNGVPAPRRVTGMRRLRVGG
jgi:hypothetical protein